MNVATEIIEKGYDADANVDGYIDGAEDESFRSRKINLNRPFFLLKILLWRT